MTKKTPGFTHKCAAFALACTMVSSALAQSTQQNAASVPDAPGNATQQQPAPATLAQQAQEAAQVHPAGQQVPFHIDLPHSHNPFAPYMASTVPPINLTNSPRLQGLIRDGKIYLSLRDAIALALENNLDIAYFRYNLPIAQADLMRTKAGGAANGVNTAIAQGTQGGFSASGPSTGSGASSGATAAGAGGLVTSTLGNGASIPSFDPQLSVQGLVDHTTLVQVNTAQFGVPILKQNTIELASSYSQAFSLGTNFNITDYGLRQTTNSVYNILSPQLTTNFNLTINQPLLQGFGLATNQRYMHIAKKNLQLTDLGFRAQVIATVTQVENIYWDLVSAYQDAKIKERSLDYANETLADDQKQLQLQAIPAMQVIKDQAAVASAEGDLTVARATLRLNELLIKNALTKTIDDPALADMPVVPLDLVGTADPNAEKPIEQLIAEAEKNRPDVAEDQIAMQIAQNNLKTIKNELLPRLSLYGEFIGAGFGGQINPYCQLSASFCQTNLPKDFAGTFENTFNYSSPEYQVGFSLNITLRNRVAKADQFRAVLDYRQKELTFEQQKKSILLDVRNSQYALQQAQARVVAAQKARDLAQKTFEIAKQEQKLGAMSAYDVLTSEQALAVAESALAVAQTAYEKAKVDIDRATGSTLDRMGVSIDDAKSGVVTHMP
ncbi:TolC family protein [Pseudacidobacterium ailaaui]|uniref:TolC family protein n=1 Tax=Pseudacidobacterium ailaaui TaxID=1382359 RepID=UPI000679C7E7|nr:TolC family protein [Pseudacidobacterium ailaaui]